MARAVLGLGLVCQELPGWSGCWSLLSGAPRCPCGRCMWALEGERWLGQRQGKARRPQALSAPALQTTLPGGLIPKGVFVCRTGRCFPARARRGGGRGAALRCVIPLGPSGLQSAGLWGGRGSGGTWGSFGRACPSAGPGCVSRASHRAAASGGEVAGVAEAEYMRRWEI